jgi:hypothetical protein
MAANCIAHGKKRINTNARYKTDADSDKVDPCCGNKEACHKAMLHCSVAVKLFLDHIPRKSFIYIGLRHRARICAKHFLYTWRGVYAMPCRQHMLLVSCYPNILVSSNCHASAPVHAWLMHVLRQAPALLFSANASGLPSRLLLLLQAAGSSSLESFTVSVTNWRCA